MTVIEPLVADTPPIESDEDGVCRVGGTRVRLETVITAFRNGCTPEQIQQKYPSLNLSDIYSVITYSLRHAHEVEAYLSDRQRAMDDTDRELEARFPSSGVRERLLARRAAVADATRSAGVSPAE